MFASLDPDIPKRSQQFDIHINIVCILFYPNFNVTVHGGSESLIILA